MTKWIKVKSRQPYIDDNCMVSEDQDGSAVRALYKCGKKYPILSIRISSFTSYTEQSKGLSISCNFKQSRSIFWHAINIIPLELVDDLVELIKQAKAIEEKKLRLKNFK